MALILTGCVSPKFSGDPLPVEVLAQNPKVLVINDKETRDGFQSAIEGWMDTNKINYVVKQEGVEHNPEELTIEYVGYWNWDLALFLSRAEIEAFYKGQRVSKVSYEAPSTLHTGKFGDAAERINLMLEIMFGKLSLADASKKL
ncbi:Sbal_3080 family lipoprotein [Pseudoalteromonas sp. NEC-BIFX-2020_015]|uniref:Sbal_3080 family lipoprotein n=1 Tax=Pseudoalteromonas sp. NEC-BIFX-2020_015 TaxID=2729544 RepID=UPI0014614087|nr:Sbal_3080 family lipoprotein [Pseudoalteromonas sp. NEC-BIFX-2020_015]